MKQITRRTAVVIYPEHEYPVPLQGNRTHNEHFFVYPSRAVIYAEVEISHFGRQIFLEGFGGLLFDQQYSSIFRQECCQRTT